MTEEGAAQLEAVGAILAAAVADGVPGVADGVPGVAGSPGVAGARGVPGLSAAVGRGPRTLGCWALGQADTVTPRPVRPDTVFDLASLTKVVATTTITLALAGQGQIGLDDQVSRHLPAATQLAAGEVTVRQLLAHASGLPATVEFYRRCTSRAQLLRELYATPLEAPPGTRVAYSDLGFMVLGEMAAAVTGEPLDAAFRRLVAEPLGMASAGYLPVSPAGGGRTGGGPGEQSPAGGGRTGGPAERSPAGGSRAGGGAAAGSRAAASPAADFPAGDSLAGTPAARIAATELRPDGTPWVAVVHDENARVMGGVAGHAGLFSTAADLSRFAAWWVSPDDGAGPVPATLRRESERCQTPGMGGHRGLGWTRVGDRYDILGAAWPRSAVSHTGFTGTSLALDAATGAWVVLLTNEVHYGRGRGVIRPLREAVHAAAAAALSLAGGS